MAEMADAGTSAATTHESNAYTLRKREHTPWWEVRDPAGELVCLTV